MDKLPVELLQRIAEHLFDGLPVTDDCARAANALSKLSRTCKTLHVLLSPVLYRRVFIEDPRRLQQWKRSYLSRANPWSVMKPGWKAWTDQFGVRELEFWYDYRLELDDSEFNFRLPLYPALEHGLLRHLTSFLIYDFTIEPHLLAKLCGPGTHLRQQLLSLWLLNMNYFSEPPVMLFVLEALEYLEPNEYARVLVVSDSALDEAEPDWQSQLTVATDRIFPSCPYELATATSAQREVARLDYSSFLQTLVDGTSPNITPTLLRHITLTAPLHFSPFSSLTDLNVHLIDDFEVVLILCTPTFPSLERLILQHCELFEYTNEAILLFRRSITHDPPGEIEPPEALDDDDEALQDLVGISWTPLSPQELADFKLPYRGPKLVELGLGLMTYT
ncbi:hypothetical protein JCM6882_002155 [Rhodosporidiobolus microsporus]